MAAPAGLAVPESLQSVVTYPPDDVSGETAQDKKAALVPTPVPDLAGTGQNAAVPAGTPRKPDDGVPEEPAAAYAPLVRDVQRMLQGTAVEDAEWIHEEKSGGDSSTRADVSFAAERDARTQLSEPTSIIFMESALPRSQAKVPESKSGETEIREVARVSVASRIPSPVQEEVPASPAATPASSPYPSFVADTLQATHPDSDMAFRLSLQKRDGKVPETPATSVFERSAVPSREGKEGIAAGSPQKTGAPGAEADPDEPLGTERADAAETAHASRPSPIGGGTRDDNSGRQRRDPPAGPAGQTEIPGDRAASVDTSFSDGQKPEKPRAGAAGAADPHEMATMHAVETRQDSARGAIPARDIRVVVNGPEHPVQVRVVERAGELHVDVRTPDPRLNGDLREQLPALTTRLEDSGFQAQVWHPSSEGQHRIESTAMRSPSGESGQESGQKGNSRDAQDQPPKPRPQEVVPRSKREPGAFAGLIGSVM